MKPFKLLLFFSFSIVVTYAYGFQIHDEETIEKSFRLSLPADENEVIVDNINGSIAVVGYDGQEVRLVVHKSIEAGRQEKLQEAREKVRLDIREENKKLRLFVDAPYRCADGSINYRGWRHYGYEVRFDFEVKVPGPTHLALKTVNHGEIKVERTSGDFDIENINGGVTMSEVAGSGRVYALNGEVSILFRENPKQDCYFGSLNGDVKVTVLSDFSADCRFKTFNGDVYTDFPVTYLPPREPVRSRENGMLVYKSDRAFGVRVAGGGPEIEFDGFNGNIYLVKK